MALLAGLVFCVSRAHAQEPRDSIPDAIVGPIPDHHSQWTPT
jgi:hypothetical protein